VIYIVQTTLCTGNIDIDALGIVSVREQVIWGKRIGLDKFY